MDISKYFTAEQVLTAVEAPDKWALLDKMLNVLMKSPALVAQPEISFDRVRAELLGREQQKPTGIARGLAFPHVRVSGLAAPALAIAIPAEPVDFGATDAQPAEVVCMMLVPDQHPTMVLRVMSQVSRFWADPQSRASVVHEQNPLALRDFITEQAFALDTPIYARDIMRPPLFRIHPETPLKEVTLLMLRHYLEATAVVDHDGHLLGQVTCDELLTLGIPDFFKQLKSISFISEFDPLEKYFEQEAHQLAGDVMSKTYAALPEDATLLEVIFELAVRQHPKVLVVREGKLVGIIDRILLLDKILNL